MADEEDLQPAPTGGWQIPVAGPVEEQGGWEGDQGADRSRPGAQWVQPQRPGLRPPTPVAPPPPPPPSPFDTTWLVAPTAPSTSPFPAPTRPVAAVQADAGAAPAHSGWRADIGAGAALAVEIGVFLQLVGSVFTSRSNRALVGSALLAEVDQGARSRLLEVFSPASLEQAVIVLVAILLTVSVPTERRSPVRGMALCGAAGLGLYIAVGATVRAVALMTFLGTSAALAVGTTLSCLAAVPVACGAVLWGVSLLRPDERARRDTRASP